MELPRTSPTGVPIVPNSFPQVPRDYGFVTRTLAALLLGAFIAVVSVTTAVSLGAYCLTSDTLNTSGLPADYLRGHLPGNRD